MAPLATVVSAMLTAAVVASLLVCLVAVEQIRAEPHDAVAEPT
ncbi:MAG TPA: hypothetical protein VEX15_05915 [Nocardioidaceae bacterium]|nr:hypothetical protein [Nocardioidaceae bacterium]